MTRAEKARKIVEILRALHPDPPIPLAHRDPFGLLVAVLLSAQTTDDRVNQVTPGLMAAAPDPAAMARLGPDGILAHIRSCGLAPQKARNLHRLSQILVERYGGRVPDDFEALESLPGVGHKTASVVMAQAFGREAFPVDTHIHRLAARWGLSDESSVEKTERDLKALFAPEDWGWLHLAIIYFGRQQCPARGHDLSTCPICSWAATKRRMQEEAKAGGGGPGSRSKVKRAGTKAKRRSTKAKRGSTKAKRAATKAKRAATKAKRGATKAKRGATKAKRAAKRKAPGRKASKKAPKP